MEPHKVVSREYKVMLRPDRFAGDDAQVAKAAAALWADLVRGTAAAVVDHEGQLARARPRRLIRFLDTAGQSLNRSGFILRERCGVDGGPRELTLKFRHADRYAAQGRDVGAGKADDARTKFEEDIKAPFLSLYSVSTTVPIGRDQAVDTLGRAARFFPGLSEELDAYRADDALAVVNGFTAREQVIEGASLQIGKSPRVDAECGLIVWCDDAGDHAQPVAVEFSYRYGDKDERYGATMSRRAYELYRAMQAGLGAWIDPVSRTKTSFVYG